MFFSAVRSRGGFNNNPIAFQFEYAYKRLLVHCEIKSPDSANCLAQDATSILNFTVNSQQTTTSDCFSAFDHNTDTEVEDDEIYYKYIQHFSNVVNSLYTTNVVEYISGFVSRKLIRQINCEICARELTTDNISISSLLTRKNRGLLTKPSSNVVKICIAAEGVVKKMPNLYCCDLLLKMTSLGLRNLDMLNLFLSFKDHSHDQDPLCGHILQLTKLILKTYFTIRLRHINKTKFESEIKVRQQYTKLIHFQHQ